MSNIVMGQVQELADSRLEEIAKRVFHTFRLAAEKSVAHQNEPAKFPMPSGAGNLESLFLNHIRQLHPDRQRIASLKVLKMANASDAIRKKNYKGLSAVNLTAAESVESQVAKIPVPATHKISLEELKKLAFVDGVLPAESTTVMAAGPATQTAMKKLELRIRKVKCVEDTNDWGGFGGDDEIHLGATTTDATGSVNKVNAFKVGDFETGNVKIYNPIKTFCQFDITKGAEWPKSYFVTLVLAEKDNGGLPDFINELTNKVREKVTAYLSTLVGGAVGSAAGPVGAVIGTIVGRVVGWVIDFFMSAWNDDIFPPQTISISLPSQNVRFNGKLETAERVVRFKMSDDGIYKVYYTWRLS